MKKMLILVLLLFFVFLSGCAKVVPFAIYKISNIDYSNIFSDKSKDRSQTKPQEEFNQVPISFKGQKKSDRCQSEANYYWNESKKAQDWANSYFKDGNTGKGNSYMKSSRKYADLAQKWQADADSARRQGN